MESALETAEARYNLVCNAVLKAGEVEYTHDSDAETEAVIRLALAESRGGLDVMI